MLTPSAARRRNVAETTAAIERAAVGLVAELGYDAVTVDMVCEAAGVSQRTFFNHFKTKDAALLGHDLPTVDERAARAFIVSDGPLLAEAIGLVRIDPAMIPVDPALMAERIRAISAQPVLLAKQMERLAAIEGELREIIELRLRRQAGDAGADATGGDDLADEAELITHILAGVMRYVGIAWAKRAAQGAPSAAALGPESAAQVLARVLPKLG
jgi:AcrR family transcriptional regulator